MIILFGLGYSPFLSNKHPKRKKFWKIYYIGITIDGFKKWVVFQECDITLDYNKKGQLKKKTSAQSPTTRKGTTS